MIYRLIVSVLATVLLVLTVSACNNDHQADSTVENVSLHTGLGGDSSGYKRACGPRRFNFPSDHAAHPEYRNEWWYITGNVENRANDKFGFHVTFFRIANDPPSDDVKTSAWSGNEFYMAHFAITSATDNNIKYYERFGRAAAGLAGASRTATGKEVPTTRVWLDDWRMEMTEVGQSMQLGLSLSEGNTGLALSLMAEKPLVLQGDKGYSQKSDDPCNSSYYYAFTRLDVSGALEFDGTTQAVSGSAWLDREWSSSALSDEQTGWDWFALQFDDGRDVMLYQLRKKGDVIDKHSHGVEIDETGEKKVIPLSDWEVTGEQWWQSESGSIYPVAGSIQRADTGETIVYKPLIQNQELDLTVRYWEGAIELFNLEGGKIGRGYMELTGY